ncbi:MAG TPA: hypothetical protein VH370_18410 [Humisphaera sp.]|jgi:hypothetical protein|nr:hypothetical protein [Humisphaera sp.]
MKQPDQPQPSRPVLDYSPPVRGELPTPVLASNTHTCKICGATIGHLEEPYLWNRNIVCMQCFSRLRPPRGRLRWNCQMFFGAMLLLIGLIGIAFGSIYVLLPIWLTCAGALIVGAILHLRGRGQAIDALNSRPAA